MRQVKHGSAKEYRIGCRCNECRGAWALYQRNRRLAARSARYGPEIDISGQHGTLYGYKQGCRCRGCKTAKAHYYRVRLARLRELGFPGYKHGQLRTYKDGCRCDECRGAWAQLARELKQDLLSTVWHGRYEVWAAGCRCSSCKQVEVWLEEHRYPPPCDNEPHQPQPQQAQVEVDYSDMEF